VYFEIMESEKIISFNLFWLDRQGILRIAYSEQKSKLFFQRW
jgi:hypothetical protein